MQTSTSCQSRWVPVIQQIRALIFGDDFCARHRRSHKDFTRRRALPFPVVMLLLLQKTTKSVQRHLHAFFHQLSGELEDRCVTAGAWTQARAKLAHTALIELNQAVVLPAFYAPEAGEHRRWWPGQLVLGGHGVRVGRPSHSHRFLTSES